MCLCSGELNLRLRNCNKVLIVEKIEWGGNAGSASFSIDRLELSPHLKKTRVLLAMARSCSWK